MSAANDPTGATSGLPGLALHGLSVTKISELVAASGHDLKDSVRPWLDRIVELDKGHPWGDDEIGEEFRAKVYNAPVNGTPFNKVLQAVLTDAGKELIDDFGPGGKQVVQLVTELDSAAFRPTRETG
jgi:hypothetical protein